MKKISDEQIHQLITQISNKLSFQFKFAYYDPDDIKQEISELVLDGITRYKPKKGKLVNFLYSHVKNRLINLRRDKFERKDKPCFNCPLKAWNAKAQCCTKFDNTNDCEILTKWVKRNSLKKNLAAPVRIEDINTNTSSFLLKSLEALEKMNRDEIFKHIDMNLPVAYRKDYVMFMYGYKISKNKMEKLVQALKEILHDWQ